MKNKKILYIIILTLAAFCVSGCYSSSKKKSAPTPARYSFAGEGSKTASIKFIQGEQVGVYLVDCDGVSRPSPAEGTYWEPDNLFPAEKPLDLRVYIYWNENVYGERRRGVFKCPPLEAGKSYKLWFKGNSKGGKIILTYSDVTSLSYKNETPNFEIVHQQIVPPPPKK